MELPPAIVEVLRQMPFVGVMVWIWHSYRKDTLAEIRRLQDRLSEKDEQLREFTLGFEKLSSALELIRERLK